MLSCGTSLEAQRTDSIVSTSFHQMMVTHQPQRDGVGYSALSLRYARPAPRARVSSSHLSTLLRSISCRRASSSLASMLGWRCAASSCFSLATALGGKGTRAHHRRLVSRRSSVLPGGGGGGGAAAAAAALVVRKPTMDTTFSARRCHGYGWPRPLATSHGTQRRPGAASRHVSETVQKRKHTHVLCTRAGHGRVCRPAASTDGSRSQESDQIGQPVGKSTLH
eukprot:COSAG01_NODE_6911_length_3443_cov_3.818746_3_plen_223_part_00